jgi:hypothetical protein
MGGRDVALPGEMRSASHARTLPLVLGWLFGGRAVNEVISTQVYFTANPETIWNRIAFYEEVPGQPPFLLRAFMPHPVQTMGEKTAVGARIRCLYQGGDLVKRITAIEPPHRILFDVLEQRLGIEDCVVALGGSYEIDGNGNGSDVVLTTKYKAYLHPRRVWRPLERLIAGQLHRHVLDGMRGGASNESGELRLPRQGFAAQGSAQLQKTECTIAQSRVLL